MLDSNCFPVLQLDLSTTPEIERALHSELLVSIATAKHINVVSFNNRCLPYYRGRWLSLALDAYNLLHNDKDYNKSSNVCSKWIRQSNTIQARRVRVKPPMLTVSDKKRLLVILEMEDRKHFLEKQKEMEMEKA